jgi:uncharacterized protein
MPFLDLFKRKKQPEQQEKQPEVTAPQEPAAQKPAEPIKEPEAEKPAEQTASPAPAPAPEPAPVVVEALKEEPQIATPTPAPAIAPTPVPEPVPEPVATKAYLKAMPLKDISDIESVKQEVRNGNIIILKMSPLATKSIEDVKRAVNELSEFAVSIEGDIARLGEERIVVCPKNIRIWREKTPAQNQTMPTAA